MTHAPVHIRRREMAPRERLAFGVCVLLGVTIVVIGWVWTVGREIKGVAGAVREEWQNVGKTTGSALEESETFNDLSRVRLEVTNALRPALQDAIRGQQAMETVAGIMKQKLYEQQTAEAEQ